MKRLLDWLDARTGFRAARHRVLDEPMPPGTGWFFTLGSVLLALLAIQVLTGAFLTLYYAATPDHAYDSVRFIAEQVASGRVVRGLHHYGASFLIVALALHLLRVVFFGSYKPPREVTWLTGVALLLIVLGFALSGYLLPWDQRAYWATVVSINISRLAPGGELVAWALRGGATIGALTLTRWYALHVIFLPVLLLSLVGAHLVLMRRQGISGPIRPREGCPQAFFPRQAARDVTVVLGVLIVLAVFAWHGAPALEAPADPTDATYVPRPEWYFLGLFQLLKYFPGRWEVVGAILLPTLAVLALAGLPWLDRSSSRAPGGRMAILGGVGAAVLAVVGLTAMGWRDRPASIASATAWSVRAIGGRQFALRSDCQQCHTDSGVADPLEVTRVTRSAEWLAGHMSDPEMIAPGLREPETLKTDREIAALIAYVHQLSRGPYPTVPASTEQAAAVFARYCIGCHTIDGDGGTEGPDLSVIGRKHDAPWLQRWITDPESVDPKADMPPFGKRLTPEELTQVAQMLAGRK